MALQVKVIRMRFVNYSSAHCPACNTSLLVINGPYTLIYENLSGVTYKYMVDLASCPVHMICRAVSINDVIYRKRPINVPVTSLLERILSIHFNYRKGGEKES